MKKDMCPCCGYYTLETKEKYDICPVCFWEDDPFQRDDESLSSGANRVSLTEARKNFREFGACEAAMLPYVRKPTAEEGSGADG